MKKLSDAMVDQIIERDMPGYVVASRSSQKDERDDETEMVKVQPKNVEGSQSPSTHTKTVLIDREEQRVIGSQG